MRRDFLRNWHHCSASYWYRNDRIGSSDYDRAVRDGGIRYETAVCRIKKYRLSVRIAIYVETREPLLQPNDNGTIAPSTTGMAHAAKPRESAVMISRVPETQFRATAPLTVHDWIAHSATPPNERVILQEIHRRVTVLSCGRHSWVQPSYETSAFGLPGCRINELGLLGVLVAAFAFTSFMFSSQKVLRPEP